ncbi:MAG: RNA methyltransferase [Armatimonadetes bacterium]|nr:RNA methyltransferase [Armatimonadota bacterium]
MARARAIAIVEVAPHVLEAISEVETPQGVVAVMRHQRASLDVALQRRDLLLLIVDRVQDPGNLGTMIRTADAAGAGAVALTPGTVDPTNPKTARATMGSLFHLPVAEMAADRLRATLRARGVRLLAADAAGTVTARAADYGRPVAVAVGNEGEGLDGAWLEAADQVVRVPIAGRAESLNAAVAAAILLYEAASAVYTEAQSPPAAAHGQ